MVCSLDITFPSAKVPTYDADNSPGCVRCYAESRTIYPARLSATSWAGGAQSQDYLVYVVCESDKIALILFGRQGARQHRDKTLLAALRTSSP